MILYIGGPKSKQEIRRKLKRKSSLLADPINIKKSIKKPFLIFLRVESRNKQLSGREFKIRSVCN